MSLEITDPKSEQPDSSETEPSPKSELNELVSLLKAHLSFQSECLQFTQGAVNAIRENLAGIEK